MPERRRGRSARSDHVPVSHNSAPQLGTVTHRTARNVGFATLADLAGKVGSLAFLVIGARGLSRGEFGMFSYAFALAGLLAALVTWGFDDVLIRDGAAHPELLPGLTAETYLWRLIVGGPAFVVVAIVGVLTAPNQISVAALAMVLAALVLDTTMQTARSAAQSRYQLARVSVVSFVNRTMTAIAGLVAVAAGFGLAGYAGAFLAGSVFAAIAMIAVLRPIGIRADFSKIRRSSFWAVGRASIPLGLDTMVAMVLFRVDALILAAYKGNDALAVYAISYRLLETILFVAFAVVAAVFPVMSSAETVARVRRAVERGVTVCAAVYVPFAIAAIFRGSGIVNLLFGAKYAGPAQEPLAWLAFAPLLIAYGNIANIALIARRRVFGAVTASIVAMVFNVALNLAIIPLLGPTGAAIATTASYLLEAVILAVLCTRLFGWARIDRSLTESAAAGGLMIAVLVFVHVGTIVDLGAAGTVYSMAWLGLSYRFAPENLAVFRQFFRRGRVADDAPRSVAESPGSSTPPPR